jgi:tryptophan halogenase
MWMKDSNASLKYGVELVDWNNEPYFVDNDNQDNAIIAYDFYTSDYFIDKPYSEFAKWHPAYRIAKKNISQKFSNYLDVNHRMGAEDFGAVHFGAYDIIKTIKELILDKITYVDTKITDVTLSEDGIDSLISEEGNKYTSDLFVDCTGFASILLEKKLKVPFVDYTKWLPNDNAVVIRTQYTNPQEQCHPYTKATAMDSGWMFTIPTYKSIGNGYVYSSKFINAEDAEHELRNKIGEHIESARHLKMKCGYHKEIAVKNVCAVGLSAGFVEPLEATGITFTTAVASDIAAVLNNSGNIWGEQQKTLINQNFQFMSDEILAFVWAHYHFSTKGDTEYWKSVRSQSIENLPEVPKQILNLFLPTPKRFLTIAPNSMFNVVQWFSVLHAGGAYKGVNSSLTKEQERYAEYFLASHSKRLDLAEEFFDNHYDYLTDWYNQ